MPSREYSIEEWRVIRSIGEGGQGSAILVQHRTTGELAVRKKAHTYDVVRGYNMPLEPYLFQQILPRSRNIVRLIHHEMGGAHNKDLILWFEYCAGGDLFRAVGSLGAVPEDFIWHCFIQIAHALDVIHNNGSHPVCHRDIKPDNIFLDTRYHGHAPWPNLKVGDFGLATTQQRSEGYHAVVWQGPEIPRHSPAGDIWGLGAIIHWMVHRRAPMRPLPRNFPGSPQAWEELPEARMPQPLPRSYSKKLNDYMLLCLAWDPRDRISSRMLVDALERDRPRPRRR